MLNKPDLIKLAFIALMIALMIASRRFFGDWADGVFIIILLFVGILYRVFIRKNKPSGMR